MRIFKKICFHKWSKWSELLDTCTTYAKLQVRYCEKCRAIDKRYVILISDSVSATNADIINTSLARVATASNKKEIEMVDTK